MFHIPLERQSDIDLVSQKKLISPIQERQDHVELGRERAREDPICFSTRDDFRAHGSSSLRTSFVRLVLSPRRMAQRFSIVLFSGPESR